MYLLHVVKLYYDSETVNIKRNRSNKNYSRRIHFLT